MAMHRRLPRIHSGKPGCEISSVEGVSRTAGIHRLEGRGWFNQTAIWQSATFRTEFDDGLCAAECLPVFGHLLDI